MKKLIFAFLFASLSLACAPEDAGDRAPTILELTPDTTKGAKLYADNCEECHEADGKGTGTDDDLTAAFASESDESLLEVVLEGKPRTRMTSFADLSNQELADIFAYAKTLSAQ